MPDLSPEQIARQKIDVHLAAAGWQVQDCRQFDPSASTGIALREVPLKSGRCGYLLPVNRKPAGVVEAKKEGAKLSIVAEQSGHYAKTFPISLRWLLAGKNCRSGTNPLVSKRSSGMAGIPIPVRADFLRFTAPETVTTWQIESKTLCPPWIPT